MEAFLVSLGVVALAEFGDKTQLLALILAARFRRHTPILLGILVASLVNHGLAALIGTWLGDWLSTAHLDWLVGLSFLGVAAWALVPEKLEDGEPPRLARYGAFVSTAVTIFLAEMGDRTQIATAALAARYETLIPVIMGTALGMVAANIPAVYLGKIAAGRLPIRLIRLVSAAAFAVIGAWILYATAVAG